MDVPFVNASVDSFEVDIVVRLTIWGPKGCSIGQYRAQTWK